MRTGTCVATRTYVWIEMPKFKKMYREEKSQLVRMCGLKLGRQHHLTNWTIFVATRTYVWIEIYVEHEEKEILASRNSYVCVD